MENHLQSKESWLELIDSLSRDLNQLETNQGKAIELLADSIQDSIKQYQGTFALLLSGGVDSSFLTFLTKKQDPLCISVGLENSSDIENAKTVANSYNLKLITKELTLEQLESYLKKTIHILKTVDIVKISVGVVMYAALKTASENNITIVLSGLGSEELFAGYKRHEEAFQENPDSVHEECIVGLKSMFERDIERDQKVAQHFNVELHYPLLSKEVIENAMNIHPKLKISKENDKIILRETAISLGLKEEFAQRKKKAAQYGSNVVKGIDKLTKQHGFNSKKEYLESIFKQTIDQ